MLKARSPGAEPCAVTDDPKTGYDFFVPPPAAAPPAPPSAAPAATDTADPQWRLNPETFHTAGSGGVRLPRWANAGIGILAVLLVASLAVAIVVPIVHKHQLDTEYRATSIELPASFNGMRGATSGQSEKSLEAIATGFSDTQAKVYGANTLGLILIVGFRPKAAMSEDDQSQARAQLAKELNSTTAAGSTRVTLTEASDTGSLGGWFGCGKAAPATVCVATDPGSMVAIVLGPGVQNPEQTALKAREASVTRRAA